MCLLRSHETSTALYLRKSSPKSCSLNGQCYLVVLCLVVLKKNLEVFFHIIFKWQSLSTSPFFFWLYHAACRILVPQPGIEPKPQQWKCQVLTTGLPGNSLLFYFFIFLFLFFNWSRVDLQYRVSFKYIAQWFSYMYIYSFSDYFPL